MAEEERRMSVLADAIGRDIQTILDDALLHPVVVRGVDSGLAGVLARRIAAAFRTHGVTLAPRVHVATQLDLPRHVLRIVFIKVRTGETIHGDLMDVLAVAAPHQFQARLDYFLDEQVGHQVFRWCSCGAGNQPAGGHEQECPLVPFEVMPRPTAPSQEAPRED
jgi:hypothetical protein